jgi:hypothetical protein
MAFNGKIEWSSSPDPDRPGVSVLTGQPCGEEIEHLSIMVQQVSAPDVFGWLLLDDDGNPVQMRNGYLSSGAACAGVMAWLLANPNG